MAIISKVFEGLENDAEYFARVFPINPKGYAQSELVGQVASAMPRASRLPAGYTEFAYIQGDGNQYIDANLKPTNNTRVVVDFQATNTNCHVFGSRTSFQSSAFLFYYSTNSNYAVQIANTTYNLNRNNFCDGLRHTVDMTASAFTYDGEILSTYSVGTFSTSYNLLLFGCTNSQTSENMQGKIYSSQVYESGTLVRDFVPAKNSNNVVGMYDLVEGKFYGNVGSGSFIGGEAV